MRILKRVSEFIGKTPLLKLANFNNVHGLEARILAKLEYFNLTGSVKGRIAEAMIEDAEAKGLLKPGTVLIGPASGYAGIGGMGSLRAAAELAQRPENKNKTMVVILPDTGERYLSTPMFSEEGPI